MMPFNDVSGDTHDDGEKKPEFDKAAVLKVLREENADADTYYTSETANAQAEALDAYFGKAPKGLDSSDENRSRIVTNDIGDTINWLMPSMMKPFLGSEQFITCDDDGLDDGDPTLIQSAEFLRYVFFKDNPGDEILHDFCFDGLLQKIGVARVYWEDPKPKPAKTMSGVTAEQLIKYAQDPEYQILGVEQDGDTGADPDDGDNDGDEQPQGPQQQAQPQPPMMPGQPQPGQPEQQSPPDGAQPPMGGLLAPPQGQPQQPGIMGIQPQQQQAQQTAFLPTFTVQVQRTPRVGKCRIEVVPPEEFRVARRAKKLKDAYHGWKFQALLSDLRKDHPEEMMDFASTKASTSDIESMTDPRIQARFEDTGWISRSDDGKVWVHIEYCHLDPFGQGEMKLYRIKRVGDTFLEFDQVDETEFVTWSPIRVAHRLIGAAVSDPLMQIQKVRTALMRKAMDSLSQSLQPRSAVAKRAIEHDATLYDRLMDHSVGDVIELDTDDVGKAFASIATPDVSPQAFAALEQWDRRSEEASGVSRHSMGVQPQAITDTKGGIENLQAASNSRIELVARWLAYALQEILDKSLRLIATHQDHARIVKINGKRLSIDPRRWSDEMTVTVNVGAVGESREKQLVYANAIMAVQEKIVTGMGPDNPLCGAKELRNTIAWSLELMGRKDAGAYIKEVPEDYRPPDPPPDPKVALEQAKLQSQQQAEQAKMQQAMQIKQAELQMQQQSEAARMQHEAALKQAEAQFNQTLAREKLEADMQARQYEADRKAEQDALRREMEERIALANAESQAVLARQQLAAQIELEQWKFSMQLKMQREGHSASAHATESKTAEIHLQKNRPGGRLDA